MSTFSRQRKQRLRDFERRVRYAEDVRTYRSWRYLTVHPFADETELLARIDWPAESCRQADIWWHTGRDIVLLSSVAIGKDRQPTQCIWTGDQPYLSVVTRLPDQTATLLRLHEAMDRIAACGLPKRCRRASHRKATMFYW